MIINIIGATGATGQEVVKAAIKDDTISEIKIFVRKKIDFSSSKVKVYIVDFNNFDSWKENIRGDVAFSCMGTTLKDAGSKEAQRVIDYDYQYHFAQAAKENGIDTFVLISAYGANPKSSIFFSRMKGELENAIKALDFKHTIIFQPGILERKDSARDTEIKSIKIIKLLNKLGLFRSQTPMPVDTLAKALINEAKNSQEKIKIIKLNKIFNSANK